MPTSFPRSFGQMAWRGSCRKPEAKLRSPESIQALRQSRRPPQGRLCLLNWDFGSDTGQHLAARGSSLEFEIAVSEYSRGDLSIPADLRADSGFQNLPEALNNSN